MMTYLAHTLVYDFTEDDVWALPEGDYTVIFDDKEVSMTNRQIVVSWYYWIMYRTFPGASILSTTAVIKQYNAGTHKKLGSVLLWHVFREHEASGLYTVWQMSKVFYEITNILYNVTCDKLGSYVTSASLHDLIEVLHVPEILEAKKNYLEVIEEANYLETVVSPEIRKVHNVVSKVLYTDPTFLKDNGIKKLCMAGLLSRNQMVQLIGPRGYVEDIDGSPFPYPINVGYAEGLTTLYDSMTESRSASRASLMNEEPLQLSEWFNRKVQLAAMVILKSEENP